MTDDLNLITGKVNSGHGVFGKLISDSTVYRQASASVSFPRGDADAMKSNFLLRGFFKHCG